MRPAPSPLALPTTLARVVAWAKGVPADRRRIHRLVRLCDLSGFDGTLDQWGVEHLCRSAQTPAGPVAAVVVEPAFVHAARGYLEGTGIRTATVVDYPEAAGNAMAVREQTRRAVGDGAEEVHLLLPFRAILAGDRTAAAAAITGCKAECGGGVSLTAILEAGAFKDAAMLSDACRGAVAEGADFLQPSAGRPAMPGATPEAVVLMLEAIRARRLYGDRLAGLKAAGGIATAAAAMPFLALAEAAFGRDTVGPGIFRLGAPSVLLDALLASLGRSPDQPP